MPTFSGDLSRPEHQTDGEPPAECRLTVGTLVVVPVQFIVVRLNKPLASAVASSLHHHCSDSWLNSSQCRNICNSKRHSNMHWSRKPAVLRSAYQQLTQLGTILINVLSVPHSLAGNSGGSVVMQFSAFSPTGIWIQRSILTPKISPLWFFSSFQLCLLGPTVCLRNCPPLWSVQFQLPGSSSSCWFFLRLSMESHYDVAPSVNALKVCADHSISNNDSVNTDIAAAAPVTGYAAQMMRVMTQMGGRDYRWPTANQRAATSLARSHPPVPCKQQHLSLSPLLCPSVWFL